MKKLLGLIVDWIPLGILKRITTFVYKTAVFGVVLTFAVAQPVFALAPAEVPLTPTTSRNWSGYIATGDTYTGVGGTWTVPTPTTGTSSQMMADTTWVGIGGVRTKDLIQAGTQAVVQDGEVVYQAWYETLPDYQQVLPFVVHGGDRVSVSLKETSPDMWQLSFSNHTTGGSYEMVIPYASSHSSVEWVEEMPLGTTGKWRGYVPLADFGSVHFTDGYAIDSGGKRTIAETGAKPITMTTVDGKALATPSELGNDNASFSITRSDVPALAHVAPVRAPARQVFEVYTFDPRRDGNTVTLKPISLPVTVHRSADGSVLVEISLP